MSEKDEREVINRLIDRCNNCDSFQCIECGIVWTEVQAISNYINKLQEDYQELEKTIEQSLVEQKERDKYTHELEQKIAELQKENKKIDKAADKMYEYISYYGWEDFESNTGCNREEMVDYFYKE